MIAVVRVAFGGSKVGPDVKLIDACPHGNVFGIDIDADFLRTKRDARAVAPVFASLLPAVGTPLVDDALAGVVDLEIAVRPTDKFNFNGGDRGIV
jgi:hypothetical protein